VKYDSKGAYIEVTRLQDGTKTMFEKLSDYFAYKRGLVQESAKTRVVKVVRPRQYQSGRFRTESDSPSTICSADATRERLEELADEHTQRSFRDYPDRNTAYETVADARERQREAIEELCADHDAFVYGPQGFVGSRDMDYHEEAGQDVLKKMAAEIRRPTRFDNVWVERKPRRRQESEKCIDPSILSVHRVGAKMKWVTVRNVVMSRSPPEIHEWVFSVSTPQQFGLLSQWQNTLYREVDWVMFKSYVEQKRPWNFVFHDVHNGTENVVPDVATISQAILRDTAEPESEEAQALMEEAHGQVKTAVHATESIMRTAASTGKVVVIQESKKVEDSSSSDDEISKKRLLKMLVESTKRQDRLLEKLSALDNEVKELRSRSQTRQESSPKGTEIALPPFKGDEEQRPARKGRSKSRSKSKEKRSGLQQQSLIPQKITAHAVHYIVQMPEVCKSSIFSVAFLAKLPPTDRIKETRYRALLPWHTELRAFGTGSTKGAPEQHVIVHLKNGEKLKLPARLASPTKTAPGLFTLHVSVPDNVQLAVATNLVPVANKDVLTFLGVGTQVMSMYPHASVGSITAVYEDAEVSKATGHPTYVFEHDADVARDCGEGCGSSGALIARVGVKNSTYFCAVHLGYQADKKKNVAIVVQSSNLPQDSLNHLSGQKPAENISVLSAPAQSASTLMHSE
jgi:hypothetical protein